MRLPTSASALADTHTHTNTARHTVCTVCAFKAAITQQCCASSRRDNVTPSSIINSTKHFAICVTCCRFFSTIVICPANGIPTTGFDVNAPICSAINGRHIRVLVMLRAYVQFYAHENHTTSYYSVQLIMYARSMLTALDERRVVLSLPACRRLSSCASSERCGQHIRLCNYYYDTYTTHSMMLQLHITQ